MTTPGVSLHGIRTVARLELTQRLRTSRWPIVLGVWVLVIAGITVLTSWSLNQAEIRSGTALYDVVTFFVLGVGMLIVPSLTATSINGDREHGVLATLQTTLLSAADIVIGKLVAAWAIAAVFLLASVPFLAAAWVAGGLSVARTVLSLVVLLLVLAAVCAIGLMFSALTARTVASAVLTYLTVAALVFGTTITFFLLIFLVDSPETVRVRTVPNTFWQEQEPSTDPSVEPMMPTPADCVIETRQQNVPHTERIWWLLPLNPFVVVADAAPPEAIASPTTPEALVAFTPMRWISNGAREARAGFDPDAIQDECQFMGELAAEPLPSERPAAASAPVWPYGLGVLLLVGGAATAIATRRVQTPVRRLPSGTRIA